MQSQVLHVTLSDVESYIIRLLSSEQGNNFPNVMPEVMLKVILLPKVMFFQK